MTVPPHNCKNNNMNKKNRLLLGAGHYTKYCTYDSNTTCFIHFFEMLNRSLLPEKYYYLRVLNFIEDIEERLYASYQMVNSVSIPTRHLCGFQRPSLGQLKSGKRRTFTDSCSRWIWPNSLAFSFLAPCFPPSFMKGSVSLPQVI